MYDNRIEYALENFVLDNYFSSMAYIYELKEMSEDGKSILTLNVDGVNICVEEYDNKKRCGFLKIDKKFGMQKCIDHFVLKKSEHKWDLYMFEIKSSVGDKRWLEIKQKMRASLLNIKALCIFLGVEIGQVYAFTTFENERFEIIDNLVDLKTRVPILGEKAENFKKDEWDKNIIKIKIDKIITIPHKAIKMERKDEILVGSYSI